MAPKSVPRLDDRHRITMKRADAFMLALALFAFANSISYFARSSAPWVTLFGAHPSDPRWNEAVGFPFVLCEQSFGGITAWIRCPWINWLGNLAVAIAIGCLSARCVTTRLAPVWPRQARGLHFSLRGMLAAVTVVGVLLGVGTISRSWGLLVRNSTCLAGPICIFGWSLYQRRTSWFGLTLAAFGLTLLSLTLDLRYQEPPVDRHAVVKAFLPAAKPNWGSSSAEWEEYSRNAFTMYLIGRTALRAAVLVFGLLSFLALGSAAYTLLRQSYPVWVRRNAGPGTCVGQAK